MSAEVSAAALAAAAAAVVSADVTSCRPTPDSYK